MVQHSREPIALRISRQSVRHCSPAISPERRQPSQILPALSASKASRPRRRSQPTIGSRRRSSSTSLVPPSASHRPRRGHPRSRQSSSRRPAAPTVPGSITFPKSSSIWEARPVQPHQSSSSTSSREKTLPLALQRSLSIWEARPARALRMHRPHRKSSSTLAKETDLLRLLLNKSRSILATAVQEGRSRLTKTRERVATPIKSPSASTSKKPIITSSF